MMVMDTKIVIQLISEHSEYELSLSYGSHTLRLYFRSGRINALNAVGLMSVLHMCKFLRRNPRILLAFLIVFMVDQVPNCP